MPFLMKGKHWSERHKFRTPLAYPVGVQAKVDEIRVRVTVLHSGGRPAKVLYNSYAGRPLYNLEFADSMWKELSEWAGYDEFDCGFECNGNFNDSRRWACSSKNVPQELIEAPKMFYLYDLPTSALKFSQRDGMVHQVVERFMQVHPITALTTHMCHNEADVEVMYARYRALGYEGVMVKAWDHLYQIGKRSQDWLKMKPEDTLDGKIEDLIEAVASTDNPATGQKIGDKLGRVGSVVVRMEDGSVARPHGIEHALGREMFEHPERFIGEWCEFAYMERDTKGGYRHPTFRRIRDKKD